MARLALVMSSARFDRDPGSGSTSVLPAMRRCTVRSGMRTRSSWSCPTMDWPLDVSTPITCRDLADADLRAERVLLPEQLVAHGLADDADRRGRSAPRLR